MAPQTRQTIATPFGAVAPEITADHENSFLERCAIVAIKQLFANTPDPHCAKLASHFLISGSSQPILVMVNGSVWIPPTACSVKFNVVTTTWASGAGTSTLVPDSGIICTAASLFKALSEGDRPTQRALSSKA